MEKRFGMGQLLLHLFFIILCITYIVPFILVISISISSEDAIRQFGYRIIPKAIDFAAYREIFRNPGQLLDSYKVTIIFTALTTILGVFVMTLMAYPLSRPNYKFKKILTFYIFFTMIFSGGLTPTYILITQYLHLDDTIWVFILPSLINAWHIFLLRTFFAGIPSAIVESALLDGAGEYKIFFSIILPLSKPALATVALLGAMTRWNDWFTAMLYINDEKLLTLQYLLQRILSNIQLIQQQSGNMQLFNISAADIPAETVRMAMAVIAAGPILFVFPFFQKYFVKGLTVGSVKG